MAEATSGGVKSGPGKPIFTFDGDGDAPPANGGNANGNGGNSGAVDPASLTGANGAEPGGNTGASEPGKRKRGRPAGSGTKRKEKVGEALGLDLIEFALMGIHTALAATLKIPELELNDEEGKKLSEAVQKVSSYYPVNIDPKAAAWFGLIMVMGTLYGPRVVAVSARIKLEKQNPPIEGM